MNRDLIIVGASAGGVEAISTLVETLPRDIPAAIFVVLHTPPWGRSHLPEILASRGRLPAAFARNHEGFETGRIYVAPPDHHLIIEKNRMILWRGPRENRVRPAVNASFRSAAEAYGPAVIGVVLTGLLDDGSAGLWWIERRGGVAVVQDPAEAAFPDMPNSALQYVDSAYVARLEQMGPLLTRLAMGRLATGEEARDIWNRKRA